MKFEVLKKNNLKRNIIIGVVVIAVILAVVLQFTRAKYRTTESIPLINGTVNYSLADLNIVAITVDGESVDTIPDGNYALLDTSYCTIDGEEDESVNLSYDMESQTFTVVPFTTKGTKCYLNFETATTKTVDTPLGEIEVNLDTPDFSKTSCSSGCDEATVGIYETIDNDGTTYYWRGDVDNNWVYFAGYYWRIIRVNWDGTIRLIYNGTTNSQTGSSTQIGTGAFNSDFNYSYYVGLSYSTTQHGTGTESTILEELNNWYNGLSSANRNYIDSNAGFCSDRNMASGYTWDD